MLLIYTLFIFIADHEPGTPELQIYEIPLDSLGHQRVYIGTKRVAPKTDEREEAVKFTKTKRQRKKDKREVEDNTLPRTGRRDHIYSSVNDEVSSTLSEGTQGNVFASSVFVVSIWLFVSSVFIVSISIYLSKNEKLTLMWMIVLTSSMQS